MGPYVDPLRDPREGLHVDPLRVIPAKGFTWLCTVVAMMLFMVVDVH